MFFICVITFEPLMDYTCSAPQNDRLNLSFVKDIMIAGEKCLEIVLERNFVS